MKLLKNSISFILLSFIAITSVSAKNVKRQDISPYLESIQLLALKANEEIYKKNHHISTYETFIEIGHDFDRLYIVNIKREEYLDILNKVKINFPGAFRATEKMKKIIRNRVRVNPKVKKNISPRRVQLNKSAILKTRRNFF